MMPCSRAQEVDVAAFAAEPRADAWAEFRDHYPGCVDCSREVGRFAALGMALASLGGGGAAHPSESQLLALATSSSDLAPEERTRLETHLAGCAPCRTELALARGFDFAAVSATPRHLGRTRVFALRRPALAAAAAVVLAVAAGIMAWRSAREPSPAPSLQTAEIEQGAPPDIVIADPSSEAQPEPNPEAPEEPHDAPPPIASPEPTRIAEPRPIAIPPAERDVPQAPPPEPLRPLQLAAFFPSESPRYAPGLLASGPSVRIGGSSRGLAVGSQALEALGPVHVGASAQQSPTLYWFLAEPTPFSAEVTVVDPDAVSPLLAATLPGPLEAGVHRVSLAEHGARLQPEVDYQWFVALVRDPEQRSEDLVSGVRIRYTPPGAELSARLSAAPAAQAAHHYAESGLWYDAFDQLSSWLAAEPEAALLRKHRAALLEQVGLDAAAAFERRTEPKAP